MKRRKYRHYKYSGRLAKELNRLAKEYAFKQVEFSKIEYNEIVLTETDKITHIRRVDGKRTILEVVNVSYETKIDDEWITYKII